MVAAVVAALVALAFLMAPSALEAQGLTCEAGETEVRRVTFTGNETFSDQELADSIQTTPTDWYRRLLPFIGERRCLDEEEVQRDALRLVIYYRLSGFWGVDVDPEIRPAGPRAAEVVFHITEGPPIILDSLVISGLEHVDSASIVRGLDFGFGERYNRYLHARNIREIVNRLRNDGFPRADALTNFFVDTVDRVASLEVNVQTGPRARIDSVRVFVEPASGESQEISSRSVRRMIRVRPGDLYRERDLADAQRTLYQLDAYRHVEVRIAPDSIQPPGDTLIVIDVGLIEGDMHAAQVGAGYGTLDCVRTQGQYTDRNFVGGARRLDVSARIWKIGVEQEWLPCGLLRADSLSRDLNYSVSATFSQPTLFGRGPRQLPSITVYSERRAEYQAYQRETDIGLIASQRLEPRPRLPVVLSYQTEFGRTEAQPALFCAVFTVCDLVDQRELQEERWLAVAGLSVVRDRTDDPFAPTSGSVLRMEYRHASTLIGSSEDVQFNKLVGDGSRYWRVGDGQVLAARLRVGRVLGRSLGDVEFIPPQERLYAGGPSSVRGYGQNELGPLLYVVNRIDTIPGNADTVYYRAVADSGIREIVPKGGNSLLVGNLEFRTRSPFLPNLLQWTAFVDMGAVWGGGDDGFRWEDLRWTPGVGLRVMTLIGAVRVDVGYNPYDRPAGAAYYAAPLNVEGAPLFCVSPTNTIPVVDGRADEQRSCPPTFEPVQRDNFISRLNFSFSIGQAF